jgi:DNA-directed RNA polymerase specialized sigma24 family protein
MQASQIVAALRANSADAPRELFDAYGEQLVAYCWQLLRSDDATLIAVRDTMIVAQAQARRLRDPGLLGPWLLALARAECGRHRALGSEKAGETGTAAGVSRDERPPPAAASMRDEILATIADPERARYRAVAAARAARLAADGFPTAAGARLPRRSRKRGRRVRGGLLTAGVAAAAAMILVAAGVSLRGGAWPAAPAASASPEAGAAGGAPTLENTLMPQVGHAIGTGLARPPRGPAASSPSAAGQEQPARYDAAYQAGPSGYAFPAGPDSPGSSWPRPEPSPPPSASPPPADSQPSWWVTRSPWPHRDPPSPPARLPGGPPRRHWPDLSPGPGPCPTATCVSGGGQAQPGTSSAEGTPRGRGHHRHRPELAQIGAHVGWPVADASLRRAGGLT